MEIYPKLITNVETQEYVAALTFDDGPHPLYTPLVLDILAKHKAKATFFMVGEAASKYPAIVKRVATEGHSIGNHSWNHPNLQKLRFRYSRLKQLWACEHAISPYGKRLFRPPFGMENRQIRIDSALFFYKVILWNTSAQDWVPQHSDEIAHKIYKRAKPGSIFLLHDAIYADLADDILDRKPMLDGLEKALSDLRGQIRFVTVPELLQAGKPVCNWPLKC